MYTKTVALDWVLKQLAGHSFPHKGEAYAFIKDSVEAFEKENEARLISSERAKEILNGRENLLTAEKINESADEINEVIDFLHTMMPKKKSFSKALEDLYVDYNRALQAIVDGEFEMVEGKKVFVRSDKKSLIGPI
jgi:hypothetical protein